MPKINDPIERPTYYRWNQVTTPTTQFSSDANRLESIRLDAECFDRPVSAEDARWLLSLIERDENWHERFVEEVGRVDDLKEQIVELEDELKDANASLTEVQTDLEDSGKKLTAAGDLVYLIEDWAAKLPVKHRKEFDALMVKLNEKYRRNEW
jgi:septal ring factor EnvC (AmiA/AmiB activator)